MTFLQTFTFWLEEKIPYDLSKIGSIIAWTLIEILSICIDVILAYSIYRTGLSVKITYEALLPLVNTSTGLVSSALKTYAIKSCTFNLFDTDSTPSLVALILFLSITMLIFGVISSLCVLALLGLKIYKLMNFDKKKEIKKSAGNDKKSILGNIYDVLGIVLLVSDDIMSFVFISYIFAVYNGPTGYGCLECLLQVTTCQKESQYIAIISQIQTFVILVVIKTLLLVVKKLVLGFFNWTKTGTVFDLVIVRLLATVMFTILSLVIIYTPGLYVLKTQYFTVYNVTGTLASIINSISNIGLMMWAAILLIATCYPIMLIFTS